MPCHDDDRTQVENEIAMSGNGLNTPENGDSGIMDSPGLEGSFQQVMSENLGRYVQIDFLVGVQTLVRRTGIIYAVGRSFVVLYDETNQNFVMCDVFSAKFVAFFANRPAPGVLPNNPMGIMSVDANGNLWPVEHMAPATNLAPNAAQPPTFSAPDITQPAAPGGVSGTRPPSALPGPTAQQVIDAQERALALARQFRQSRPGQTTLWPSGSTENWQTLETGTR